MTTNQKSRRVRLPYAIDIEHDRSDGSACLVRSNLYEELSEPGCEDERARAAADAVESLLLALVAAGIELDTAAGREAVESAVESIAQNL